jgi:benzodiazapine receptor
MKINIPALAFFIIISQLAGIIGAVFTLESVTSWYAGLEKPFFTPPSWVFGPVWTALYLMMGVAAYLAWEKGYDKRPVREALNLFGTQLALNAAWSVAFFGLRSPLAGLALIIPLWLSIVWTMQAFSGISKTAGDLFVPYLAWVSFATLLNASIVILNP